MDSYIGFLYYPYLFLEIETLTNNFVISSLFLTLFKGTGRYHFLIHYVGNNL